MTEYCVLSESIISIYLEKKLSFLKNNTVLVSSIQQSDSVTYIFTFFGLLSIIGCYKILNIAPHCAMYIPVAYLLYV